MAEAFSGQAVTGSGVVYTVPRAYVLRLEILTFTMVTDATAGVHKARVLFTDKALNATTARLRDLNEGGPTQTLRYTFGIGLNGSACVSVTGWEMTDALPDTVLAPQTTISLAAVDDGGSVIGGDAFSGVVLYGDLVTTADGDGDGPYIPLDPGLLPGAA